MNGISDAERLEELRERRDSAAKDLEWALEEATAAVKRLEQCRSNYAHTTRIYDAHANMMAQRETA